MKRIEWFISMQIYFARWIIIGFDQIIEKINPLTYLYKSNFAKKKFKEKGLNEPIFYVQYANYGVINAVAKNFGYFIVFLILNNITLNIGYLYELDLKPFWIMIHGGISYYLINKFIFKGRDFLLHFDEMEKMEKSERNKWFLICLGFIIVLFIWTLISLELYLPVMGEFFAQRQKQLIQ